MRKCLRVVKRAATLVLTLILTISSFAAVVSDNDGSAFITKAEFDSLKNSFQAQIDTYNTSIDAKIDGAIAAYLAGIRITNWEVANCIGYTSDGTLSVRGRDDLKWINGRMYGSLIHESSRQMASATANIGTQLLKGTTPKNIAKSNPFYELGVKNVDYTNGTAEWAGYSECYNGFYFITTHATIGTSWMTWSDAYVENAWISDGAKGAYAQSNVDFGADAIGDTTSVIGFNNATSDNASYLNAFYCDRQSSFFSREINKTDNKNIIITQPDVKENRFSNFDKIKDFHNDDIDGEFNKITDHGQGANGFLSICQNWDCKIIRFNNANSTAATQYKPTTKAQTYYRTGANYTNIYLGFVRPITNYNQLWTSQYDSYVEDMVECHPTMEYKSIQDKSTKKYIKHLSVRAGLPIVKVDKNYKVKMQLNFKQEDTNGDGKIDSSDSKERFQIWFKWGGFGSGKPWSEDVVTSGVMKNDTEKGSYNSSLKSWTITNGDTLIVPASPKKGYLFIKWSKYGNDGKGGGTFIGTKEVQVIKAE